MTLLLTQSEATRYRGCSRMALDKAIKKGLHFTLAANGKTRMFDPADLDTALPRVEKPSAAVRNEVLRKAQKRIEAEAVNPPTVVRAPRASVAITRAAPEYEGILEEPSDDERRQETKEQNRVAADEWRQAHYQESTAADVLGMKPRDFEHYADDGYVQVCEPPREREYSASKRRVVITDYPVVKGKWFRRDDIDRKAEKLAEGRKELLRLKGEHPDTPVAPRAVQGFLDIFESLPEDVLARVGVDESARATLRAALAAVDKIGAVVFHPSVPGSANSLPPGTTTSTFAGPVTNEDIARHEAGTQRIIDKVREVNERAKLRREHERVHPPGYFPSEWKDGLKSAMPLAAALAHSSPVAMPPGTTSAAEPTAVDDDDGPPTRPCAECGETIAQGKYLCGSCGRWSFGTKDDGPGASPVGPLDRSPGGGSLNGAGSVPAL
jgi:hypothetical protein